MSSSGFFRNTECECFPCHEVEDDRDFNCIFCYCPLYFMGTACGGDWTLTDSGIKDCSRCVRPHLRENYTEITETLLRECRKQCIEKSEKL